MAKKAAAQNGRADLPVSQDARQRDPATKLKLSFFLDTRAYPATAGRPRCVQESINAKLEKFFNQLET
jgi:hypothetical protein